MQPALPLAAAARAPPEQSRIRRVRGAVREIVEVQGGHIVRSTGRKDRHSKVCTAKGPRDRRVRLSAHTAIQFYDVQDRLGYDRPSKAVDWLIKNAKAAIDQLAELPPWTPTATASTSRGPQPSSRPPAEEQPDGESGKRPIGVSKLSVAAAFDFGGSGSSSFLPPSLDSDAIADSIKSFFPIAATSQSSSPPIGFHAYPPEMLARSSSQSQDLRLSLQSFQDPIFHSSSHHHGSTPSTHNSLLAGAAHLGFDAMPPWNVAETSGGGFDGAFSFNVPPPQAVPLHSSVLGSPPQLFSQRGPLQSSNPPSARSWAAELIPMHPALHFPIPPAGFAPEASFRGFRIPARIQGEEDHHQNGGAGGDSSKLPSPSSASCH